MRHPQVAHIAARAAHRIELRGVALHNCGQLSFSCQQNGECRAPEPAPMTVIGSARRSSSSHQIRLLRRLLRLSEQRFEIDQRQQEVRKSALDIKSEITSRA